jgi:hypothetical protein
MRSAPRLRQLRYAQRRTNSHSKINKLHSLLALALAWTNQTGTRMPGQWLFSRRYSPLRRVPVRRTGAYTNGRAVAFFFLSTMIIVGFRGGPLVRFLRKLSPQRYLNPQCDSWHVL